MLGTLALNLLLTDAQGAAGAQEKEIFQAEQAEKAGGAQQKGQQLH